MLKNFIFISVALVCGKFNAQEGKKSEAPKPAAELNWYLKDPKADGVYGVGAEKAYQLLTGKTPKDVIVAVIDSGVETDHPDLKDVIYNPVHLNIYGMVEEEYKLFHPYKK